VTGGAGTPGFERGGSGISGLDLRSAESVAGLLERAADALVRSPLRRGSVVHLPERGHLAVSGDLHDNPLHLAKIQAFAKLDQGLDRHVVLQELIHGDRLVNGLDLSYRVVARVAALVERHPTQVHPLLANHELCQMMGIGVSKGHGDGTQMFREGLDFVFGEDAFLVDEALAKFVRAMPLAVRTASGVWCSHSVPAPPIMHRFDRSVFDRELSVDDYRPPYGSAYLMVWGRGQDEEHVERLARAWDVQLFCLGHAHSEEGAHVVTSRMAVINSDHDRGRVVEIDLAGAAPSAAGLVESTLPLAALGGGVEA
jgi:hypothetical protein